MSEEEIFKMQTFDQRLIHLEVISDPSKKTSSRRDFLKLKFGDTNDKVNESLGGNAELAIVDQQIVEEITASTDVTEEEVETFLSQVYDVLKNKVVSRREFLPVAGAGAALAFDMAVLKGRGTYYLTQIITNQDFRDKFMSALESGELLGEDIPNLISEIVGAPEYSVEMGESLDLNEDWFNTFESTEVRTLTKEGEETGKLIFVAELGNISVVKAKSPDIEESWAINVADFPETISDKRVSVLPRTQKAETIYLGRDQKDYYQLTPRMYSAYKTEAGEITEFFEENGDTNPRGGALIVEGGNLKVVDTTEVSNYKIGENDCEAIEVVAYTIRSTHKEQDLEDIKGAPTLSGLSPDSPSYASFIATFDNNQGQKISKVISIYNHIDTASGEVTGKKWEKDDLLTITQAVELCEQIKQEGSYENYIIAVPDPDEHSTIIAPDVKSDIEISELESSGRIAVDRDRQVYQEGEPFVRSLWTEPYSQVKVPVFFLGTS